MSPVTTVPLPAELSGFARSFTAAQLTFAILFNVDRPTCAEFELTLKRNEIGEFDGYSFGFESYNRLFFSSSEHNFSTGRMSRTDPCTRNPLIVDTVDFDGTLTGLLGFFDVHPNTVLNAAR